MRSKRRAIAKIFKAFCDENRLEILEMLQSGEKCACMLQENLKIGQSTLSHHMKVLIESGIVGSRKDGKWVHYSLNTRGIKTAKRQLEVITQTKAQLEAMAPCPTEEE